MPSLRVEPEEYEDANDGAMDGSIARSDVVAVAAALANRRSGTMRGGPNNLRPPAIVTEFMAGGSLRGALGRATDMVSGALTRVMIALDAAKVGRGGCAGTFAPVLECLAGV
jgi:hypothetical protein